MDTSIGNHEPVIIKRPHGKDMILLSLQDYESLAETAYLLGNKANAQHLRRSLQSLKQGKLSQKDLIEEIERLNTKLMKISNYNDLEIEEYEKEIERLNNEHYLIHKTWLELKHQYEILKLEI